MTKYATNIRERWVALKRIIHDYNYWKESKDSKPIHTHAHTHTHKKKKYKRKTGCHQKNNSDVKTFKRPKNIKEL